MDVSNFFNTQAKQFGVATFERSVFPLLMKKYDFLVVTFTF